MFSMCTGTAMSARGKRVLNLTENQDEMEAQNPVPEEYGRRRMPAWALPMLVLLILIGAGIWFMLYRGPGYFRSYRPANDLPGAPGPEELKESLNAPEQGSAIEVIATIFPISDIVKNVGGEKVSVTTLIPAGSNPHTYEISPGQAVRVSRASLFIRVGGGLDDFVDKITSSIGRGTVVLTLTDGIDLVEGDPHIWLDPVIVKERIAPAVTEALRRISPQDAAYFEKNRSLYQNEVDTLHDEIQKHMAGLTGRPLLSIHSAWRYFCLRYGLKGIYIEEFPGKEPSAQWISTVTALARKNEVRAVFVEPQFSPKMAETIARELGVKVYKADPIGGEGVPGFETYIDLMRSNVQVFREALGDN